MNLQQENKAEKQLIVGSLKVLNNIEGGGFEAVASDVNKIQQALGGFVEKQNEYWKDVAADNVINAFEKKSLKKEWDQIEQTYNAIIAIAQEKRLIDADEFKRLADTRQALYVYLFQTLKVFDNMSESTPIPDTTVFSQKYNDYYEAQSYAQSKIAGTSAATIRVLNSLDELGTENEIAIYRNCLYMYKAGQWIIQNSGMYLGAVRDAPPTHMAEDNFFLAINDFKAPARLKTSNGLLVLSNGKYLQVTKPFYSGWIYVSKNGTWNKMEKTDYRYAIVLNDLLNYKLDVPDTIKDFIKANTEVDFAIPEYLGPYDHDPSGAKEGDWYLYIGPNKTSPDTRNNGYIYRYKKENDRYFWQELNPNSSQVESYYMAALKDILVAEKNLTTGMYSTIFANALFTCKAVMEALSANTITLTGKNGIIQSENPATGFSIKSNGSANFAGSTHIGGSCTIDGQCVIQDKAIIYGQLDTAGLKTTKLNYKKTLITWNSNNTAEEIVRQIADYLGVSLGNSYSGTVDTDTLEDGYKIYCNETLVKRISIEYDDSGRTGNIDIIFYGQSGNKLDEAKMWWSALVSYTPLNTTVKIEYEINNKNTLQLIDIPKYATGIPGQLLCRNGIVEVESNNSLQKLHYPAGTPNQVVIQEMKRWIKSGYTVSCIGNYGTDPVSSIKVVTTTDVTTHTTVTVYKTGTTSILTMNTDDQANITKDLNVMLLQNTND